MLDASISNLFSISRFDDLKIIFSLAVSSLLEMQAIEFPRFNPLYAVRLASSEHLTSAAAFAMNVKEASVSPINTARLLVDFKGVVGILQKINP